MILVSRASLNLPAKTAEEDRLAAGYSTVLYNVIMLEVEAAVSVL